MKDVCFFSGLGADKRVFERLNLQNINAQYIEWSLANEDMSLSDYAKHCAASISFKNPIFIGVSFGGIVALECAKYVQPEKIILISSVANPSEIPTYYRLFKHKFWKKILPTEKFSSMRMLNAFLFGVNRRKDVDFLNDIIKDTNPDFLKWALHEIVNWNTTTETKNIIQIHGKKDRLLPIPKSNIKYTIEHAGHFMIVTHAHLIEKIIQEEIDS